MDRHQQGIPPWFHELVEQVRDAFTAAKAMQLESRPSIEAELSGLRENCSGWVASLGNSQLPLQLRAEIEQKWTDANARIRELEQRLSEAATASDEIDKLVDPADIMSRLDRLAEILANYGPTVGNLELSLHIDSIVCHADKTVVMRMCKLGLLADGVSQLIANSPMPSAAEGSTPKISTKGRTGPRRRGRLRLGEHEERFSECQETANHVADPHRFAGLPDEWFWTDVFRIPEKTSWAEEHAEAVFIRRQETRASYGKLAREFGVSKPTIRAALCAFLSKHPDATDKVTLPRGGARPIKFNLEEFADEALTLWEAGWSKLKLAKKFGCSPPVIDKALQFACAKNGRQLPTRAEQQKELAARVRELLDSGMGLQDIARTMNCSDVTARKYLNKSLAQEGKRLPDLRRSRAGIRHSRGRARE